MLWVSEYFLLARLDSRSWGTPRYFKKQTHLKIVVLFLHRYRGGSNSVLDYENVYFWFHSRRVYVILWLVDCKSFFLSIIWSTRSFHTVITFINQVKRTNKTRSSKTIMMYTSSLSFVKFRGVWTYYAYIYPCIIYDFPMPFSTLSSPFPLCFYLYIYIHMYVCESYKVRYNHSIHSFGIYYETNGMTWP